MLEDFNQAKMVYLTTFSDGEKRSRPMTNFDDNPYRRMCFQTYRDTRKVNDIEGNQKVIITFPSSREGVFYEIMGKSEFEDDRTTTKKWKWWYLHWQPRQVIDFFPWRKTVPTQGYHQYPTCIRQDRHKKTVIGLATQDITLASIFPG